MENDSESGIVEELVEGDDRMYPKYCLHLDGQSHGVCNQSIISGTQDFTVGN